MATVSDTITDYSRTQRIVLLIDLNPLLHLQNPNPYLTTLLASAETLLSFPPLSSSLFSFKPFFSSLSPLLSSSKLPFRTHSLSFDHPDTTLQSLKSFLFNTSLKENSRTTPSCSPRASNVAASMRQLVHDYAWDPEMCDSISGKIINNSGDGSDYLRSNLVVLFSPVVKSSMFLSEFLNVNVDDECLRNVDLFSNKFCPLFQSVNDAFISRDIHFSWVDVKCELESSDVKKIELKSGFFESGIRGLGWGFCSSDSVILGSALVHFGLIYPRIGVSSRFLDRNNDKCKKVDAQLSLEILDVSGKPLECKCCDLELVNMEVSPRLSCDDVLIPFDFMKISQIGAHEQKNRYWGHFGDGIVKLHVKAVYRFDEGVKFEGQLSDLIMIRECLGGSAKDGKESSNEFFADGVLKILAREMGEFVQRKVSIWQIFLSFLYKKGYWALVSFSNGNGDSQIGMLKPFTVFSAFLSIIDSKSVAHSRVRELVGMNLAPFVMKMDNEICKPNILAAVGEAKGKRNKKNLRLLQDLTWNAFCKEASEHTMFDLEEVYFAKESNNTKKFKFFKCWMKQIDKSNICSLTITETKPHKGIPKEIENRLAEMPQESERPIPSSASVGVGDEVLTGSSRIQDDAAFDIHSETLESFFSNLPKKMQQGLESEGVDVGALAERLVNSSVYWLYQKREMEHTSENQTAVVKPDEAYGSIVAVDLTKLLLREPKDLFAKHKNRDTSISIQASDPRRTEYESQIIVREYELQILFRMEILQSEIRASIEEPMKQKFVKQICLLLDAIQCHLQGGFFGDWSLDNYVQKIIKDRYCDTLGDVVHKIYTKMDLLLFADEDEAPNSLLNSEDSNQSWRNKKRREEIGENSRVNESLSVEDESLGPDENDNESTQGTEWEEHARKVTEAHERRERARRFSSFTSWMPDLQRVWAPKQQKSTKPKSFCKLPKRKDRKRTYDKVCETPMTGNKRSCSQGSSNDDGIHQQYGTHLCDSVSKALFRDDFFKLP